MLEDAVNDAANTKGRFDNVRGVLLLLRCIRLLCKADHFSRQRELLVVGGDRDCLSLDNLGGEAFFDFLFCLFEEISDILLVFLEGLADDFFVESGDS